MQPLSPRPLPSIPGHLFRDTFPLHTVSQPETAGVDDVPHGLF